MAFLDTDRGRLVVRIVFDGTPLAGKTTTVRSLAESLGTTVESPEEMLGRTIFFDWLEYTGGLWNGHRICCQVLTVPGQSSLGGRRFELLRLADCVVFVFDASTNQLSRSLAAVEELGCVLSTFPAPKPKVLLQLNKRDLPDALPREELLTMLPPDYQDVAETIATGSTGIRDVFVRAVRLALQRAEALQAQGDLPLCRPALQDSAELLASLKAYDEGEGESSAWSVPLEAEAWHFLRALESEADSVSSHSPEPTPEGLPNPPLSKPPLPPSSEVPAGAVWPPARGRTNLQEFSQLPCSMEQKANGDWKAKFGATWVGLSRAQHEFDEFDLGRKHLLELTRLAIQAEDWLSPDRCLILSPASDRTWRLWEVMPQTPPLQSLLVRRLTAPPEVIAAALVQVFRIYQKATTEWPEELLVQRLSPAVAGLSQTKLVYTGYIALPQQDVSAANEKGPAMDQLIELAQAYLQAQGLDLEEALRQLRNLEASETELSARAGELASHLLDRPETTGVAKLHGSLPGEAEGSAATVDTDSGAF
ncbi:MAG: GTPase domain-containing protein [Deltaproteobacteria bacterium]|nr:GTPase domain-containing protein [Deltaproteobacteria bacterium]